MTDAADLQALLDGPHAALREDTRRRLSKLGLERADGLPRDDYRDLVLEWTREVGRSGDGARSFPASAGGQDDPPASSIRRAPRYPLRWPAPRWEVAWPLAEEGVELSSPDENRSPQVRGPGL